MRRKKINRINKNTKLHNFAQHARTWPLKCSVAHATGQTCAHTCPHPFKCEEREPFTKWKANVERRQEPFTEQEGSFVTQETQRPEAKGASPQEKEENARQVSRRRRL